MIDRFTPWLGLVGVLVGGSLAYIVARVQIAAQDRREMNKHILGKIEELHKTVAQFNRSYVELTAQCHKWLNIPPFTPPEIKSDLPLDKLQMLLGIYTPKLDHQLNTLLECRKAFEISLKKADEVSKMTEESKKITLDELNLKQKEIADACRKFQNELIMDSRKYTRLKN